MRASSWIGLAAAVALGISFSGCSNKAEEGNGAAQPSSPRAPVASEVPGSGPEQSDSEQGTAIAREPSLGDDHSTGTSDLDFGPYCDGWEKPAAIFAATGQMYGYFEPCGCSDPQFGGVSRRAELLRQLEERGWPTIPVDLGGTMKRVRQQSQFKFQTRYGRITIGRRLAAFSARTTRLRS